MTRSGTLLLVASAGLVALLTSPPVAARSPSPAALAGARRLHDRAENLRHLRIPLRQRRARRNLKWAYDKLEGLGVHVDRRAPVVLDTTQELRLLRRASAMLRGAAKGSAEYRLRRKVVTRAFKLHRELYKLPRAMRAYTSVKGKQGKPELVINLDNSFYNKAHRLLPIVAHEHRHLRDIRYAQRLEAVLKRPGLRDAKPGTRQYRRKQRLQAKVDALMSSSKAETRAFQTQARALALAGGTLGNWWRAIQGGPIDRIYPPAKLNRALIKGYMQGIAQSIGSSMRDATPKQRAQVARYLAGYKSVLKSKAAAFFEVARKDGRESSALLEQYKVDRSHTMQRLAAAQDAKTFTAKNPFAAGQADAYAGVTPRAQQLLGR